MELTATEAQIVRKLKEDRVVKWTTLAEQIGCSTKSVQRALAKVGYFGSINHNGVFATAKDTPRFDQHGLWMYQTVCFSKHGNLPQTLHRLVEQSSAGFTVEELERLVGTRVHNHVSRLIRGGKLARCFQGRKVVYLATDPRRREAQQQTRRQAEPRPAPTVLQADVPPGLDAVTVIHVLRRLLETPDASVASVARALQARKVLVRADQFGLILDFYGIKKTTA
jgi:hypothetical protein